MIESRKLKQGRTERKNNNQTEQEHTKIEEAKKRKE